METKDIDNSNRTGTTGTGGNNDNTRRSSAGSFGTLSSVPGGGRRYSSNAQSSAVSNSGISISSASVFAPSVYSPHTNATPSAIAGGNNNNNNKYELQPSSARLLQQWNKSANSSLLSSLGTAASKTFRSYKMTLPRFVPPPPNVGGEMNNNNYATAAATPVESDLELLGRTVHAVSSALTEPPKEGDKYMIYDVSFNSTWVCMGCINCCTN
jgi:hypothetical protein